MREKAVAAGRKTPGQGTRPTGTEEGNVVGRVPPRGDRAEKAGSGDPAYADRGGNVVGRVPPRGGRG